jgi:diguanylate cyclase (GGDEF)-like protein/PAS domain S-box-containing protein
LGPRDTRRCTSGDALTPSDGSSVDAKLQQSFHHVVEDSPTAVFVHQGGRVVYVNRAALRLTAADSSNHLLGQLITEFIHPEAILVALTQLSSSPATSDDPAEPMVTTLFRVDGTRLDIEAVTAPTTWQGKHAHQTVLREITAANEVAHSTAQHFQSVVTSLDRGIVVIRRDGSIDSINPAAIAILGYGSGRFPGTHSERALDFPVFDTDGHVLPAAQRPVNITLRTGQSVHGRVLGLRRHDGHQIWISFTTTLLDAADGDHSPVLMCLADVTAEHLTNQQLRHHAHHDALTGLPNRTRTIALITAALTPSENPRLAALMFIDIDHLKQVNDSLGHHAGDQVLRACAERLKGVLRSTDTLTRVGGDEFIVLVAAPAGAEDLQRLAQRLHDALKEPITIDAIPVTTSASIGVTAIDTPMTDTPADILRRADAAMYQAKASGRGQTCFYVPRNGSHHRADTDISNTGQTIWAQTDATDADPIDVIDHRE